jgi:hypothetical protein
VSYEAAFLSTAAVLLIGFAMALRAPETVHRSRDSAQDAADPSAEGAPEVGEQVVDVLDADGKTHQI